MNFNLEPVHHEIQKKIKTTVPDELVGTYYLRNGPNPYLNSEQSLNPEQSRGHLFDGDGMIHVIKFEKDHLIYSNKWVRTYRFKTEKKHKLPLFVRLGNLTSIELFRKWITRILNFESPFNVNGEGTANTNIVYHAGKLLALNELDKPYLLELTDTGSFKTVGRYDFDGKLSENMNAHPKIDSDTCEMICLGYNVLKRCAFLFFVNKDGKLYKQRDIPLNRSSLIHDIGITKRKVIILDLPLEFSLMNILKNSFPIGVTKGSRIGIVDRHSLQIQWISLPQDEIVFHIANSWEISDDIIVMYAFCYDPETFDIQHLELERPRLKKFTINLKTEKIKIKVVSTRYGELPVINISELGQFSKWIYYSQISERGFNAIVKHNTETNEEQFVSFGEGLYGGESAIYDKYLINIVYSEKEKLCYLTIYDKDTLELMKFVPLGLRIPFGFHGNFIK